MPLHPDIGKVALQEAMLLDERWIMSYAAGLKDDNKRAYFDTRKENPLGKITAHPCQYWAISWPFVWNRTNELLKEPMPPSERGRGVHYTEDVLIHKPFMANTNIRVSCMAVDASQRKNGCTLLAKFDMYNDVTDELLMTHWSSYFYRGVKLKGGNVQSMVTDLPPPIPLDFHNDGVSPLLEIDIPIAFNEAHVYTECSRIWNPIHTNKRVAAKAGLSDIILHGTATLAKATTELINAFEPDRNPKNVKRIRCGSFAASVLMPSTVKLRVFSLKKVNNELVVHWDVLNASHRHAIRNGLIVFRQVVMGNL